jgi:Family of unknown function (DUF6174)
MRSRSSFVIALLVVAGCGGDSPLGTQFEPRLLWARVQWESRAVDSYAMTVTPLCFCGFVEPVRVTVRDGVVVSRVVVSTGGALPAQHASSYPDVPGLFARIDRAHEEGADSVDADFDESYGFPTGIWIDWKVSLADDEEGYRVEDFSEEP